MYRCITDIVTVTDDLSKKNKIQIYISGTVHGNERVGPSASYYLIEYLLTNF